MQKLFEMHLLLPFLVGPIELNLRENFFEKQTPKFNAYYFFTAWVEHIHVNVVLCCIALRYVMLHYIALCFCVVLCNVMHSIREFISFHSSIYKPIHLNHHHQHHSIQSNLFIICYFCIEINWFTNEFRFYHFHCVFDCNSVEHNQVERAFFNYFVCLLKL